MGGPVTCTFTIITEPVGAIATTSLLGGTVGAAYSQTIAAIGDPPITWSLQSGSSLPAGLTLDAANGTISGTATFTVKVTNAVGKHTRALSLTIADSGQCKK